jgi:23S rRNA (uracil747-C5)-methyltransferase
MHCDHYAHDRCRSCAWLDRPYAGQLAAKDAQLHALLDRLHPARWDAPVASAEAGFRHKAKMVVLGGAHPPRLGIVNHQQQAIGLCDCPLYPADMRDVLQHLEDWIGTLGIAPYDVAARTGEMKFLLLTRSYHGGDYLLRLVLRSEQSIDRIAQCVPMLRMVQPAIRVVSVNLQPAHMAVLEGEREILLTEQTRLAERLNDVPLYIRPKSFFQTNPAVAARLYATARAWLAPAPPVRLWDLFCGVGGFGLHCATPATALTGVEVEPEARACARQSAAELGLARAEFVAPAGADPLPAGEAPDVVIVNPPRRGIGEDLCARLTARAPARVLYSSCNPDSLVRDLARLPDYRLSRVQLFDMFPHTAHYEVLVALERAR